jgi:hypothetical protein
MFVEYIRILNVSGAGDADVNYYQILLKLAVIAGVGLALIYLGKIRSDRRVYI